MNVWPQADGPYYAERTAIHAAPVASVTPSCHLAAPSRRWRSRARMRANSGEPTVDSQTSVEATPGMTRILAVVLLAIGMPCLNRISRFR
jgi:hypothetical protein